VGYWLVVNDDVRTGHGGPSGSKLVPGATSKLLAQPECSNTQRAAFTIRNLWVTPTPPVNGTPPGITRTSIQAHARRIRRIHA